MSCAVKLGWAGYCEKFVYLYQNIRHHRRRIFCRYVCYWRRKMRTWIWWENLNEIDHWVDTGIEGKIIIKLILNTWMWGRGLDSSERRDMWWAVVSTLMNLRFPWNARNFWNIWETLRFQAGLYYMCLVIFWFGHPPTPLWKFILKWSGWTSWIQNCHLSFNCCTLIGITSDSTGFVTLMYLRNALPKIIMSAAPNVFNILIKLIFSYYTKWIIASYVFY